MQVRQVIAAALLAVTAVGAMAQEIDRAETLQGKSLAAQADQAARAQGRTRESVVAETRNLKAEGQLNGVGELAGAPAVAVVPQTQYAGRTRADVKGELAQWRQTHKLVVGERG
jgi:type II secretory pathway pseudopilin PulG